jgi:hypothetical protein
MDQSDPDKTWEQQDNLIGAAQAVTDYYSSSYATESMPAELESQLADTKDDLEDDEMFAQAMQQTRHTAQ